MENKEITKSILALLELKEGWLNGRQGGEILYCKDEIGWLVDSFNKYYPNDISIPLIYPTVDGRISAEWNIGTYDISLEIDLKKRTGYFHIWTSDKKNNSEAYNLELNMEMSWCFISERIRKYEKE